MSHDVRRDRREGREWEEGRGEVGAGETKEQGAEDHLPKQKVKNTLIWRRASPLASEL